MLGRKLIKVPYIDQTTDWPTGCECVSTVMLLQYLGVDITMEELVEQYLEKEPFGEADDGSLLGPDPGVFFAGEPDNPDSMGCYAPVICKTLTKVIAAKGIPGREKAMAVNLTEVPMETILKDYIDCAMPVIFWATIDLKESIEGPAWKIRGTEDTFTWRSNEHCMLLVGYDDTHYYFNDPWHNHGCIGYDRSIVELRHGEEHSMAVSLL